MNSSRARYLDLTRLGAPEYVLCVAGPVLFAALFLPWFHAFGNGHIGAHAGAVSAWHAYSGVMLAYLLWLSAGSFILPWIIARGHELSWREGEMTMVFGLTGVALLLCNGIVFGRPGGPDGSIDLQLGYVVGMLATLAITVAAYRRQAALAPNGADRISRIWMER